jgi:hypothetical protein
MLARSTSLHTNSYDFSYYLHFPHDLDPIGFYHSRFQPVQALTSRSDDPADRNRASVAFEPADPSFTHIGRLAGTRVAERPSVLYLISYLFHCQSTGQIGWQASHSPGSHVCRARRWRPIFASTETKKLVIPLCNFLMLASLSMHYWFSHLKFHKPRWASTLNQKHIFVITSLFTTQFDYGWSFDELSEDFLARFQDI